MRVFVSHKSEDTALAQEWAEKLESRGFNIYLDAYDNVIKKAKDRPLHIQNEIDDSSDLLVIVTENTQDSWWVPFEVGLSTALDKRIASLLFQNVNLPSFLRKWPVIDTEKKWGIYLEELGKNRTQLLHEHSLISSSTLHKSFENFSAIQQSMRNSDLFHSVLMSKFGQN